MRILVLGSGGREHALVWKLRQSPKVEAIYIAPGNAGTNLEGAHSVPIAVDAIAELVDFAKKNAIDFVVPGPELPLTLGVTDAFVAAGIPCFGPDQYCAQLEGSKLFAKNLMQKAGVPTAACRVVRNYEEALEALSAIGAPVVVKADGLAQGKGVIVAKTLDEAREACASILRDKAFGSAGETVLLEEFLEGEEVSLLCFCDGKTVYPMPSAQDHKAAYDNDTGPNTGGMGAYSPCPRILDSEREFYAKQTVVPVVEALSKEGHPYRGVLYAGLMLTQKGPYVLEYNVRFGDPECQPLLMRLESDLLSIMESCLNTTLDTCPIEFSEKMALGIVLAAKGYPGSYTKGIALPSLAKNTDTPDCKIFHSGTKKTELGIVSCGGRILCVTALGSDLRAARERAYAKIAEIEVLETFYRHDIGNKALK